MSNDASLVAGQIQDVSASIDDVASAIRELPAPIIHMPELQQPVLRFDVPQAPPPSVIVEVPAQPPPVVNVAAPSVEVKPRITVPAGKPVAYEVRITERDASGYIAAFTMKPVV